MTNYQVWTSEDDAPDDGGIYHHVGDCTGVDGALRTAERMLRFGWSVQIVVAPNACADHGDSP